MIPGVFWFESNLGPTFEIGPETIHRKDKGAEVVFALADIVRVRAFTLGADSGFELVGRDGRKMLVVSHGSGAGYAPITDVQRREYYAFVVELHRRLAATQPPVEFVIGILFKKKYSPLAIPSKLLP